MLTISRQTMQDEVPPATLKTPTGGEIAIDLSKTEDGLFEAEVPVDENGLFEVNNGDMRTLVHVGAVNAPEFTATVSTTETLAPLAAETGGLVQRVAANGTDISLPSILPVRGQPRGGSDRMMLSMTDETELKGRQPHTAFWRFLRLGPAVPGSRIDVVPGRPLMRMPLNGSWSGKICCGAG